jgi:hypothetical protein
MRFSLFKFGVGRNATIENYGGGCLITALELRPRNQHAAVTRSHFDIIAQDPKNLSGLAERA